MTLALLLTAVTGAWAQSSLDVVELEVPADWENNTSNVTAGDLPGFNASTLAEVQAWTGAPAMAMVIYAFNGDVASYVLILNGKADNGTNHTISKAGIFNSKKSGIKIYYTGEPADPAAIEVTPVAEPAANTKQWTFAMPGSDVVLTPIYAKAAAFATESTSSGEKTLLPEAAEGVIAGTDASLIAEGTGIVAFAGTSTDVTQGTLMYAIGTSATEAPALTAFSATVPTAKDIADDGATVNVGYYIQGADAPDGVAATLDNTFDNTEPACLTVQVLTNKFDIQFNAANANTIEAGKATVTVGGTAATVTEGKLQGVKMGTEVKLKANTGYKFRKVEVKKKAAAKPLANATTEDLGKVVGADGKIYATKADAEAVATGNAVAMICYVNEGHGLALALTDEGDMDWSTAKTTCAAHTPAVTGATWKLASKSEMNLMINAAGNYAALRNGFSAVGGTNMSDDHYWLSDESSAEYAQYIEYYDGTTSQEFKSDSYKVRACLAF